MAAGSEQKKNNPPVSPNMQIKHTAGKPNVVQQPLKITQTHLPQQQSPKLQTIISKSSTQQSQVKTIPPISSPPIKTQIESVQPAPKLPNIPARPAQTQASTPSSTSPPASEPPKIKAPVLPQTPVLNQRGPPPAIPPRQNPVRSGSVQSPPTTSQVRPVRRQASISMMPQCTPQPPVQFVIPQRRGSITRQTSVVSSTNGAQTPKKS